MTLSVRGCLLPTSDSVGKIGIVNACGHDVGAVVVVRLPIDIFLVPSEGQCGISRCSFDLIFPSNGRA